MQENVFYLKTMKYMYLVINNEEDPFVIDICTNLETAEELKEMYDNNFLETYEDSPIIIEKISNVGDVLWTAYPEDQKPQYEYGDSEVILP